MDDELPIPTVALLASKYPDCPQAVLSGLINYGWHRVPTGSFLRAVLENDLKMACAKADDVNRYRLFEIVNVMYNELDHRCQGSPEKVTAWLAGEEPT